MDTGERSKIFLDATFYVDDTFSTKNGLLISMTYKPNYGRLKLKGQNGQTGSPVP